jgi:hypothetical protein
MPGVVDPCLLRSRISFDDPETQDLGPAIEARKYRYDADGIHVMPFSVAGSLVFGRRIAE